MRNVQKWTRGFETIRVFQFGGIMKTAATFLEGTKYRLSNPKGVNGVILHTGVDQVNIRKGEYILLRETGLAQVLSSEEELFKWMAESGYQYVGNERVRNTQLSDEIDTGMIKRWGDWAETTTPPGQVHVDAQLHVYSDTTQPARACGTDQAPEGWECTRQQGHTGPCAAVEVEPVRTDAPEPFQYKTEGNGQPNDMTKEAGYRKPKTFFEKLLGFLPIFRR